MKGSAWLFWHVEAQPVQHILIDLLFAQLVEYFVAHTRVQFQANLQKSGLPEPAFYLSGALAIKAHWVLLARNEENRQILRDSPGPLGRGDFQKTSEQIPIACGCKGEIAQRV